MLELFGTIIIVYVLWLVVKPLVAKYLQRKFQQKVNDMFRQAYGFSQDDFRRETHRTESRNASPRKRNSRKIFSREDGEYIEFEDIKVEYSTETDTSAHFSSSSGGDRRPSYTPREPQVSDAEWEEI